MNVDLYKDRAQDGQFTNEMNIISLISLSQDGLLHSDLIRIWLLAQDT